MNLAENFLVLIKTFNWHSPSWDLFIILAWIIVSVIYTFAAGRGRVINILISIFMAKLLVLEAPFLTNAIAKGLPDVLASLQQLAAFVVVFLVLFVFLGRYAFRTSADSGRMTGMVAGIFFSFLQIGLLINIILNFLPKTVLASFSPLVQAIFLKTPANFIWLTLPLLFLILLGRFVGDSGNI